MTDALISKTDREEALSRAYLAAVAAGAGYTTAVRDFDRDGVAVQIQAGGSMRPALDVQLKATINLGVATAGFFRFVLKRRNYDLLRVQTMLPRILVVLSLPESEADWLSVTAEELVIRRCAYWAALAGAPDSDNSDSVTISIHDDNRFDVDGLKGLMELARTGVLP